MDGSYKAAVGPQAVMLRREQISMSGSFVAIRTPLAFVSNAKLGALVGRAYMLGERSEAYAGDFATKVIS